MKGPDGFLILLCPLVSCLRKESKNFRNWRLMHSSLGADAYATFMPWVLPQWTGNFSDQRHSVIYLTAFIGCLPRADTVLFKIKSLPREKKATWQRYDPVICNYQPNPSGVLDPVCDLMNLNLPLMEFYHPSIPLRGNTKDLFKNNYKKIPQALKIGQEVEN